MNQPLVSIIIPTYNRPDFLKKTLDSALSQTYVNIEIIVVDDCSELNLEAFSNQFPSVKFLKNDSNRGACYSRNRGLKLANGDYVNFLDDDDELFPEKIELQIEKFKSSKDPKLGMITCHSVDYRSGEKKVIYNRVRGNIYQGILAEYIVAGTETMLFKASVFDEVEGFDEGLESSQEYDLFIRACEKYHINYVDKILTQRNRSRDQISLNFDKKIQGARALFNKHNWRYKQQGILYWIKMRIKLRLLLLRFYIGKLFGEKVYRRLLVK